MEYVGDSRVGLVRSINQDSILLCHQKEVALFVVADGMGGHLDGEKASKAITEGLQQWWEYIKPNLDRIDFFKMVDTVRNCIEEVNQSIYNEYQNGAICGSTVSILLIYKKQYAIFHVGDSRIYKFENKKLNQLTMDEVWENDIRTRKKFTFQETLKSNKRGKLINAVGTTAELMITIKTDELREDMVFFICSDGFYKMVSERYLAKILKKIHKGMPLNEGMEMLMNKVHQMGAKDNVSMIIINTGKM